MALNHTPKPANLIRDTGHSLDSGLVGAYAFNEGAGTTITDLVDTGNVITLTSGTWESGAMGTQLTYTTAYNLDLTGWTGSTYQLDNMTFLMTVRHDTTTARVDLGWYRASVGWFLRRETSFWRIFDVDAAVSNFTTANYPHNDFNQVVLRLDSGANHHEFFQDGVSEHTGEITGQIFTATDSMEIGYLNGWNAGSLLDIRLWNRPLTNAEVAELTGNAWAGYISESAGGPVVDIDTGIGIIDNGASFISTGKHLEISQPSQVGLDADTFSVSLWMNASNSNTYPISFTDSGLIGWQLEVLSSTGLALTIGDTTTNSITGYTPGSFLNTMTHIAFTRENTGNAILYVNATGIATGATSATNFASTMPTVGTFSVGARNDSSGQVVGVIDEIGLWDRVLTAQEISSLYNTGGAVAFPFGQQIIKDVTGQSISQAIDSADITRTAQFNASTIGASIVSGAQQRYIQPNANTIGVSATQASQTRIVSMDGSSIGSSVTTGTTPGIAGSIQTLAGNTIAQSTTTNSAIVLKLLEAGSIGASTTLSSILSSTLHSMTANSISQTITSLALTKLVLFNGNSISTATTINSFVPKRNIQSDTISISIVSGDITIIRGLESQIISNAVSTATTPGVASKQLVGSAISTVISTSISDRARTVDGASIGTSITSGSSTAIYNLVSSLVGTASTTNTFLDEGLLTNLVSHWKLEESTGTRFDSHDSNDLSLLGNTGSLGNAPGKIGNALLVNPVGGDAEVSITDAAQVDLDSETFTLSAWFNVTGWDRSTQIIASKYTLVDNHFWQLFAVIPNTLRWNIGDNVTFKNVLITSTLTTGTWHHIVVSHTPNDGGVERYWLDGVSGQPQNGITGSVDNAGPFSIANRWGLAGGNTFEGYIDEVSFWKRVLTESEVQTLYNGGTGLAYPFASQIYEPTGNAITEAISDSQFSILANFAGSSVSQGITDAAANTIKYVDADLIGQAIVQNDFGLTKTPDAASIGVSTTTATTLGVSGTFVSDAIATSKSSATLNATKALDAAAIGTNITNNSLIKLVLFGSQPISQAITNSTVTVSAGTVLTSSLIAEATTSATLVKIRKLSGSSIGNVVGTSSFGTKGVYNSDLIGQSISTSVFNLQQVLHATAVSQSITSGVAVESSSFASTIVSVSTTNSAISRIIGLVSSAISTVVSQATTDSLGLLNTSSISTSISSGFFNTTSILSSDSTGTSKTTAGYTVIRTMNSDSIATSIGTVSTSSTISFNSDVKATSTTSSSSTRIRYYDSELKSQAITSGNKTLQRELSTTGIINGITTSSMNYTAQFIAQTIANNISQGSLSGTFTFSSSSVVTSTSRLSMIISAIFVLPPVTTPGRPPTEMIPDISVTDKDKSVATTDLIGDVSVTDKDKFPFDLGAL